MRTAATFAGVAAAFAAMLAPAAAQAQGSWPPTGGNISGNTFIVNGYTYTITFQPQSNEGVVSFVSAIQLPMLGSHCWATCNGSGAAWINLGTQGILETGPTAVALDVAVGSTPAVSTLASGNNPGNLMRYIQVEANTGGTGNCEVWGNSAATAPGGSPWLANFTYKVTANAPYDPASPTLGFYIAWANSASASVQIIETSGGGSSSGTSGNGTVASVAVPVPAGKQETVAQQTGTVRAPDQLVTCTLSAHVGYFTAQVLCPYSVALDYGIQTAGGTGTAYEVPYLVGVYQ